MHAELLRLMRLYRMKWKQFGLLILVLLAVVPIILTILHTISYQRYIQETTERYLDRGFTQDFIDGYIDFDPWHRRGIGQLVIRVAVTCGFLWVVAAVAMVLWGMHALSFVHRWAR